VDADRLLDGLNEAQRRAVTSSVVPLCILAGAGSGKTRVLTRRIAYRAATEQHDPRRVLALTFTRKAAGELNSRLRQLGLRDSVVAGTFHAIAYAQLRARWADRGIAPPALLDRKVGFVAQLLPASRKAGRTARDVLPLDVVAEIEWAKARRVTPEHYPSAAKAAGRTPPLEPRQIADVLERYEQAKRDRRLVDFDDLLSLCTRDLLRDETFADAQRWRHRHFFVDEYQDVNPLQQGLLDAWMGDRTDLCVVGDPNQAIYAWNGADASYLTDFTGRWNRGEVVRLAENYRSSPQVLAVANAVLAGSSSARRASERGDDPGLLRANRPDGPVPVIRAFADDRAEAHGIARAARDLHKPRASWSAQAVLVRTNAQTSVVEDALRKAGIPFRVKGGTSLLDQPEVKAALAELRGRRDPFLSALTDLETMAARWSGDGNGSDDERATGGAAEADSRQANLEALVRLGHDHLAIAPNATTADFLAWLSETSRSDQPDAWGDAVDVMTFHAAKGLEWPIVHLAGLEQGLVPIGHAKLPAELAEERRLFYVAATRAESVLRCTWSETRTFGTTKADRTRSPYLNLVEAACDALEQGAVPVDWEAFFRERAEADAAGAAATSAQGQLDLAPAASSARSRSASGSRRRSARGDRVTGALSTLSDTDRDLLESLKDWRLTMARGASVPTSVIFDDTTLNAIAAARPRSTAELRAVKGVRAVAATRFGDGLLQVIAEHVD
jgi:DNA helicase-2/ATP-dependent DNA helicase PcrA